MSQVLRDFERRNGPEHYLIAMSSQTMTPYSSLINQSIHKIPTFNLECGAELRGVPIAYKTWGKLNSARDNVMIICHAFTGSADVEDW